MELGEVRDEAQLETEMVMCELIKTKARAEAAEAEAERLRGTIARAGEVMFKAREGSCWDFDAQEAFDDVLSILRGGGALRAPCPEAERLRGALRELGHDWCREHCDGDDHSEECERAIAILRGWV